MVRRFVAVLCMVWMITALMLAAGEAQGAELGVDKYQHAAGCAIITAGTYAGVKWKWPEISDNKAQAIAFGVTMLVGVAKEVYDYYTPGHSCEWQDLAADWAGAGAVLTIVNIKW